jgi:hypothetical protein
MIPLTADDVNAYLAVIILILVTQVFVKGSYASFVAKLLQLYQPIQYIIPFTADDVNCLLPVSILALVVQVFVDGSYASFVAK